jgi:hypothetical protein
MTHVPLPAGRDEDMARILRGVLQDPDLPARHCRPEGWPPPIRQEWGDDQYENFQEDIIPAFCVLAYESIEHRPWAEARRPNVRDEPKELTFTYKGHRPAAKALTAGLLETYIFNSSKCFAFFPG